MEKQVLYALKLTHAKDLYHPTKHMGSVQLSMLVANLKLLYVICNLSYKKIWKKQYYILIS